MDLAVLLHDSSRQDLQEVSCISSAVAGNDKLSCRGALTPVSFSYSAFQLKESVSPAVAKAQ